MSKYKVYSEYEGVVEEFDNLEDAQTCAEDYSINMGMEYSIECPDGRIVNWFD